jgi:predicted dehydrogenase
MASHQIDQFLWFTGAKDAEVVSSTVANYTHPESPTMQDFGEVTLRADGVHGYVRVDYRVIY